MAGWISDILYGVSLGWFILSIVRDTMVEAAQIIGGSIKVELSTSSDALAKMMLLHEILEKKRDEICEKKIDDGMSTSSIVKEPAIKKSKFKVGDMVIGNEKANKYVISGEGFISVVTHLHPELGRKGDIQISIMPGLQDSGLTFSVDEDCFDLYEPEKKSVKKPSKKSVKKPAKKTKK